MNYDYQGPKAKRTPIENFWQIFLNVFTLVHVSQIKSVKTDLG